MSIVTPFNPTYCLSNALNVVEVTPNPANVNNAGYTMTLTIADFAQADPIAIMKQPVNPSGKVFFDLSEVLRVTDPTLVDHGLGFQFSGPSVVQIELIATEVWTGGQNQIGTATGYVVHGAQQFEQGLLYNQSGNINGFLAALKNTTATVNDYGVVGVLMPSSGASTVVEIAVFDANNNEIAAFNVPLGLVSSSPESRVQFVALYPKTLEQIQVLPSIWSYYTATVGTNMFFSQPYVDRVNADGGTVFLTPSEIDTRLFEITCPIILSDTIRINRACELPYRQYRLAFSNNLGGWDYFNFDLNHTETMEIQREEFTRLFGTWSGSNFNYNQKERGRKVYDSVGFERTTISAKVTSEESEALKMLVGSREVQLLNGSDSEAIIITDTSFPVFHDLDRSNKTLTITFERAHNKRFA